MTTSTLRLAVIAAFAVPMLALAAPQQNPPATIAPPQAAPGTTPEAPAGAITGTVIDGVSGDPVAGALVYLAGLDLRPLPAGQTRQVTDAKGRFAFVNLSGEATYTITASKFGYLDGGYGRDVSPNDPLRPVLLKKDEWVPNLRVQLWRPGSISGAVRDEAGEPVVGVFVRALARFRIQGRDDIVAGPIAVTNDRGEYRLAGLVPGRYLVQVPSVQASVPAPTKMPPMAAGNAPDGVMDVDDSYRLVIGRYPLPPPPANGRPMAYPVIFHPSAGTLSQAMPIELKFADDRPNIDLTLTPVPAVRVSGVVEGPPDALKSLTLRLLPVGLENIGFGAEAATALVGADGRFTFLNVAAGSYTIDAPVKVAELTTTPPAFTRTVRFPPPPPTQGFGWSSGGIELVPGLSFVDTSFRSGSAEYSGRAAVTVGASDVDGVVVRLRPHVKVTGRVVVEADPSKTDKPPARFTVRLDPAGGEASMGMPQSSFQQEADPAGFTIQGVQAGLYWVRIQGYPAWVIKSVLWKGRDYLSAPIDTSGDDLSGIVVTVTNAAPELSGSVRASDDVKTESAMVVVFPADRAQWRNTGLNPSRVKYAPVSSTGTYKFTNLPAGEYLAAAIDRSLMAVWRDPEFLARLERVATHVTLTWGAKTGQDLAAVAVR